MEELKTKLKFLLIAFTAGITSYAQNNGSYNLQKCIDLALQNNLTVTMAKSQMENGKAKLQQAEAGALPTVSGYANQGISTGKSINPYTNTFINQEVTTGQYGLNASLNLFSGLNTINSIQQNASSYKADKMDYEQAKLDLSIQVTLAYLQVLTNEELLNQALLQIELTQAQLNRLSVLDKSNAVSPSVLYDTKGQLANDRINLINTKAALTTAKLTLAQLINTTFGATTTFEKIIIDKEMGMPLTNFETTYSELQNTAPLLRSAHYRKTSALKSLQAARGLVFPSLSLNGSLGSNYSSAALSQKIMNVSDGATDAYVTIGGSPYSVYAPQYSYSSDKISFNNQVQNNLNTYIGLSLQVPIFNSLRNKTQIKFAKINYEQSQVQLKTTEIRFKSIIEQLHADLANAYERYLVYIEQTNDYSESFKIATVKFEQGSITTVEYMSAKNNMDKAKASLITSQYEYLFKKKTLDLYKTK